MCFTLLSVLEAYVPTLEVYPPFNLPLVCENGAWVAFQNRVKQ